MYEVKVEEADGIVEKLKEVDEIAVQIARY